MQKAFYLKFLLCIAILALWAFYITNTTSDGNNKKQQKTNQLIPPKLKKTRVQHPEIKRIKQSNIIPRKKPIKRVKQQNTTPKKKPIMIKAGALPALVTLKPQEHFQAEKQAYSTDDFNLKRILNEAKDHLEKSEQTKNVVPLRQRAPVKKEELKPIAHTLIKERIKEEYQSWLPRYIEKTEEIKLNQEKAISNLDRIASEIKLTKITQLADKEKTATIKTNNNNQLITLKEGEEYNSLKLLKILKSSIILGNTKLNKTYEKILSR